MTPSEFTCFALVLAALAFAAWREIQHDLERRDLLNRLMARDYAEYKELSAPRKPPPPGRNFIPGLRRVMDLRTGKHIEESGD